MNPPSTWRPVLLAIAGTLGAAIAVHYALPLLEYGHRINQLEEQEIFYHGDKWPPPGGGMLRPVVDGK